MTKNGSHKSQLQMLVLQRGEANGDNFRAVHRGRAGRAGLGLLTTKMELGMFRGPGWCFSAYCSITHYTYCTIRDYNNQNSVKMF